MLLSLIALTAHAEPLFGQPVAFADTHDPAMVSLTAPSGEWRVQVRYGATTWETVDAWEAGRSLTYAYTAEEGPLLIDPLTGSRLPILRMMEGTPHPLELMESACLESAYSTLDMSRCTTTATGLWTGEIERMWGVLETGATPEQLAAATAARQAWATFRDAQTAAFNSYYASMDGTIVRLFAVSSRQEMIRSEANQLSGLVAEVATH